MQIIVKLLLLAGFVAIVVVGYVDFIQRVPPAAIVFGSLFFGLIALIGCGAFLLVLADMRRRRSLRQIQENGRNLWVWTDLAGRPCRSDRDPRPRWDAPNKDPGGKWGY